MLELAGFDQHLDSAHLVITGEGALDEQTLQGKGPAEVARRAAARSLPVLAVAGAVRLYPSRLREASIERAWDLLSRAGDSAQAMARTEELLEDVGREIGAHLSEARLGQGREPS